jgi:hydrogenase maturation protease
MTTPANSETALLVIGYGNTLRQDDQAGPVVAEIIEGRALSGVRTLVCAQLSPEHAEPVADARTVVFVDAQAGPARETCLQRVLPGESSQVTTHAAEPRTLLALARDVYGRVPEGWMLTVPAERMGFGTDVSEVTRRGIEAAVGEVLELARLNPAVSVV